MTGKKESDWSADLGCGTRPDPRATIAFDMHRVPGVTIVGDVLRLPFKDDSLGALYAHQVVEHLPVAGGLGGRDPFFVFFDEAWRVLRPGGRFEFDVPHFKGVNAVGDPTHRRLFEPRSFSHLWDAERDPGYPRKIWRLVGHEVTRFYPTEGAHLERWSRPLDVIARRLFEWFGPYHDIRLTICRPSRS